MILKRRFINHPAAFSSHLLFCSLEDVAIWASCTKTIIKLDAGFVARGSLLCYQTFISSASVSKQFPKATGKQETFCLLLCSRVAAGIMKTFSCFSISWSTNECRENGGNLGLTHSMNLHLNTSKCFAQSLMLWRSFDLWERGMKNREKNLIYSSLDTSESDFLICFRSIWHQW